MEIVSAAACVTTGAADAAGADSDTSDGESIDEEAAGADSDTSDGESIGEEAVDEASGTTGSDDQTRLSASCSGETGLSDGFIMPEKVLCIRLAHWVYI
ncbi:MAG: hypothetical protein EOM37_07915 [Proteobacteria bacterium]|nr:hypothetical protein [Pseudomonadota bacterium]